jgi:hypothetical protein
MAKVKPLEKPVDRALGGRSGRFPGKAKKPTDVAVDRSHELYRRPIRVNRLGEDLSKVNERLA